MQKVFAEAFDLPIGEITDDLAYGKCAKWDSIAHMTLVASIDTEFNTMMDMDDIIDMGSFKKAKELLSKYGIEFSDYTLRS